jgi:3-vinyl bacteriochlorophyllide hydratase
MRQTTKETRNSRISDGAAASLLLRTSLSTSKCPKSEVSSHSYAWFVIVDRFVDKFDCAPWATVAGTSSVPHPAPRSLTEAPPPLYTAEERRRRDASPWTTVQGVLAPVQFAVFLVSLGLVVFYLSTGEGLFAATTSIVAKTLILYAIMVTGSIWEREVFGRYLFARPFFWEDVVSIGVLALHTAYLFALAFDADVITQMTIALLAYASYLVNATQFLLKLRTARLQGGATRSDLTSTGIAG